MSLLMLASYVCLAGVPSDGTTEVVLDPSDTKWDALTAAIQIDGELIFVATEFEDASVSPIVERRVGLSKKDVTWTDKLIAGVSRLSGAGLTHLPSMMLRPSSVLVATKEAINQTEPQLSIVEQDFDLTVAEGFAQVDTTTTEAHGRAQIIRDAVNSERMLCYTRRDPSSAGE
jgi:hypothetical protein